MFLFKSSERLLNLFARELRGSRKSPVSNDKPAPINTSEDALFSNEFMTEMSGVVRLNQDKIVINKKAKYDEAMFKAKRLWAEQEKTYLDDPLGGHVVSLVAPHDPIAFRHAGIQNGVFHKLRLGKYDIDARLDLHQLTVDEARKEVFGFLKEAQEYDLRTVLIMHGKGDRNPDPAKKAVLKNHTAYWLKQLDSVLAFHSAQPRDGGTGAVYVLLRKSAEAKQHNREGYGLC